MASGIEKLVSLAALLEVGVEDIIRRPRTTIFDQQVLTLDLSDMNISFLPEATFRPFPVLYELTMDLNELVTLPVGIFDGFVHIERLSFFSNRLASLPDGLFDGPFGLKQVRLAENQLQYLSPLLFKNLPFLEHLDLSHNRLAALPATLHKQAPKLQTLLLLDNPLQDYDLLQLAGFQDLEVLSLKGCRLDSFPWQLLDKLKHLRELDLRNTDIPMELIDKVAAYARLQGHHLRVRG